MNRLDFRHEMVAEFSFEPVEPAIRDGDTVKLLRRKA